MFRVPSGIMVKVLFRVHTSSFGFRVWVYGLDLGFRVRVEG